MTIEIANPSGTEQEIGVTVLGVRPGAQGRVWKIAEANWTHRNDPCKPRELEIVAEAVNQAPAALTAPPFRIEVFGFAVQ